MFSSCLLFIGKPLTVTFQHISNIKHRLGGEYSLENIFNAKILIHIKTNPFIKYGRGILHRVCSEPGGLQRKLPLSLDPIDMGIPIHGKDGIYIKTGPW